MIRDVERFDRSSNTAMLPLMAEAITKGTIATTTEPNVVTVDLCEMLTGYRPDARILVLSITVIAAFVTGAGKSITSLEIPVFGF